jgi:hypothetical protein
MEIHGERKKGKGGDKGRELMVRGSGTGKGKMGGLIGRRVIKGGRQGEEEGR